MADQPHPLGERSLCVRAEHVMHVEVVRVDVAGGLRASLGDFSVHVARDTPRKAGREPVVRPVEAAPLLLVCEPLREVTQREIQQCDKGDFGSKEVSVHVSGGRPLAEQSVHREEHAHVELACAAGLAPQLHHVPVHLLQNLLEAVKSCHERVPAIRVGLGDELSHRERGEVSV